MRHVSKWAAGLGMVLALLGPRGALADAPPTNAVIGDGVVSLGVSDDAGLAQAGIGLQFAPTSADGLARLCDCSGWLLTAGNTPAVPTTQTLETFAFT